MQGLPRSTQVGTLTTKFQDVVFRSNLEARWAVFFANLNVHYAYEPEGYQLPGPRFYRPDFYLGHYNLFVEIKGTFPTFDELDMCQDLAIITNKYVLLCWGPPGWWLEESQLGGSFLFNPDEIKKEIGYFFDICPACSGVWLRKLGLGLSHVCGKEVQSSFLRDDRHTNHPLVRIAARVANDVHLWEPRERT